MQSTLFPHTPAEISENEVRRFLDDKILNAERHPDILALLFAAVAKGMQIGQYERSGNRWLRQDLRMMRSHGDAFGQ